MESGLIISSVLLFSDKLFENGSYVFSPNKSTNRAIVPIKTDKNLECEIESKVIVGKSVSSEDFLVVHSSIVFK